MNTDAKSSKEEAEYQGHPNGAARCADCSMFVRPSGCTAVEGRISPNGWCIYYERKEGTIRV